MTSRVRTATPEPLSGPRRPEAALTGCRSREPRPPGTASPPSPRGHEAGAQGFGTDTDACPQAIKPMFSLGVCMPVLLRLAFWV